MTDPIKAFTKTVQISDTLSIDGYLLPNGEFRAGIVGTASLLGYKRNWLLEIESRSPKKLEALHNQGYRGTSLVVIQRKGRGGANRSQTISLQDLTIVIAIEAQAGNKRAIALQSAFTLEGLDSRFRDTFKIQQRTPEEKRYFFAMTYDEYLQALAENRSELEQLRLPGDDLYYPSEQDWEDNDN